MVGITYHKLIKEGMAKVRDWENYLDEEYEEKPRKVKKFKDSEDRPQKKRKS